MRPEEHLRPEIAFGYRNRLLTPDELRAADAHIAVCDTCREQLASDMDAAGMAAFVREALREGAAPAPIRRYLPWISGALVAAAAAVWLLFLRPAPELFPGVHERTTAAVTAAQKQAVETAMRSGRLPWPPFSSDLAPRNEVLMGAATPAQARVELLSPAGTVVLPARPTFRWKPLAGGWTYTVRVFRPNFEVAAESPTVTSSEWTPEQDLAPGITYEWQVEARHGAAHAVYPQPPQTPPRFRIADAATAAALRRLAQQGVPHLVLAVEYARASLVDDARRELSGLVEANPRSPELRRLLESLH